MAKRFKFKIFRILSFKSCRSKDHSSLPANPVPSFLRPSPVNPSPTAADLPPRQPRRSSFKRQVSSALGCGMGRRRSSTPCLSDADRTENSPPPPTPRFQWESKGKWHVIAKVVNEEEDQTPRRKIYDGGSKDDVLGNSSREKKKRRHRKRKTTRRARVSASSADDGGIVFTSESFENDDGEETESLIPSSRSFSPEDSSSDLNPSLKTIQEVPRVTRRRRPKNDKRKAPKRCVSTETKRNSTSSVSAAESDPSPARLSMFVKRFVPCAVAAAAAVEGVAVVKRSDDPYEDFKGSMMEMIVEKKLFEAAELERLLHCFLTLNSRRHHGAIIKAFSEIWEALFTGGGRRSSNVHRLSDYEY